MLLGHAGLNVKKKFDRLLLILFTATFLKGKHNVLIMA